MNHWLKTSVEKLNGKYYTPKKAVDKIEMNLLIKNPPYAIRKGNSENK